MNETFTEVFGQELFALYKARFPINEATVVQTTYMRDEVRYALPHEADEEIDVLSPIATLPTAGAKFTQWYIPNRGHVYLAFAPEINTVFVRAGMHNV